MPKWFNILSERDRLQAAHWIKSCDAGTKIAFKSNHSRSLDQNALLWALLTAVSQSKPDGREYAPAIWKCLFMQAWGREVEYYKSLDGQEIVPIFRSSELSKQECTDLIEFIISWCTQNNVQLKQQDQAA